jgi:transcriptional regulator with XRE-family HTH domain
MSTKNFSSLTKLDAALTVKCSKHRGVSNERENLGDYLRRVINEKNLTYRQVAERSGGRISHAAISDIISGKTKEIKSSTISALAKGLGVSEEEIFAVIRGKSPTDDPDYKNWKYAALFDDAKKLSPEQMRQFETIMDIARREVTRMLQEQEQESLHRSKRVPPIVEDEVPIQQKEKKRA